MRICDKCRKSGTIYISTSSADIMELNMHPNYANLVPKRLSKR